MGAAKQKFQLIKNVCVSLAAIVGFAVVCTHEQALAGADTRARQMTRVEWESGEAMNCNSRGVEYFVIASNVHFHLAQVSAACLTQSDRADWVILGGISSVSQNRREGVFLERSLPKTNGSGNSPNIYSFARFTIGYDCILESRQWQCKEYSAPIENSLLKTFGSGELRSTNDSIALEFKDLKGAGHYHTTNRR
ncbi:hypothetical protein [Roseofilum casamattae]|uniref:Chromophore lyase CpcS/CpeS n=1 Tax=Roseofilum casamattae BLCC-M143 TaxID=3022442 RepID=A0ABT7BZ33_9CYAN|nr:hypothetical protein [Roseofilum casamattae]MDJ1184469.1 hypothetical protein [Roseofilum casamattae BLCC-M143]